MQPAHQGLSVADPACPHYDPVLRQDGDVSPIQTGLRKVLDALFPHSMFHALIINTP